jgi:hypothetical protein
MILQYSTTVRNLTSALPVAHALTTEKARDCKIESNRNFFFKVTRDWQTAVQHDEFQEAETGDVFEGTRL